MQHGDVITVAIINCASSTARRRCRAGRIRKDHGHHPSTQARIAFAGGRSGRSGRQGGGGQASVLPTQSRRTRRPCRKPNCRCSPRIRRPRARIDKALTTLGRPGIQVAAITRRAEGYFIVHVEAARKTTSRCQRTPIGPQARRLNDNDVVNWRLKMASSKLSCKGAVLRAGGSDRCFNSPLRSRRGLFIWTPREITPP